MSEFVPLPEGLSTVRRLGVVADTHIPDRVRSLHPDLLPGLSAAKVEAILHAGDICSPAVLAVLSQVAPVVAVRGNRDWAFAGTLPWAR
ncbi:MAG: metallophosphoesterase family protein, partial [Bellilinea sp.]